MKLLPGLLLVSLAGCAGVYAEVAATSMPSASVPSGTNMTTTTSASSVGFNIGADFGSTNKRFALGYTSESISLDNGSAKLVGSDMRFDFNVFSVSDRAKLRLGLGVDFGGGGSSSSTIAGMERKDASGGGAYGGLDFTYFLTWHIGLHAFAGARYMTEQVANGSLSGSGATFRLTATYQFGDVRPDYEEVVPLDSALDITGVIESGAQAAGCRTSRRSNPTAGYAYVDVTCGDRDLSYFQIAEGIMLTCHHMTQKQCKATNSRILDNIEPKKSEASSTTATAGSATPAPTSPAPTTPAPTPPAPTTPADPATPPAPTGDASPAAPTSP